MPAGPNWFHEVKYDGYRIIGRKEDDEITLFSRSGLDWTVRFPAIAKALLTFPAGTALLDGWRGAPSVPRAPLTELTERVAWLLADQPLLAELDLNPVRAGAQGRPLVLDARARRIP